VSFEEASAASPSLRALGKLGCQTTAAGTTLRLYAPSVHEVILRLYQSVEQTTPTVEHSLQQDTSGVWTIVLSSNLLGWYYDYQLDGQGPFADPYSLHVATKEPYPMRARSLIMDELDIVQRMPARSVNRDIADLVVYEAHVKDMVAKNPGSEHTSVYKQWSTRGECLHHIMDLGMNAVEFLPLAKSVYHEPPYQPEGDESVNHESVNHESVNHWNPTAINHWGYMTAYFLAPETRHATPANVGEWSAASPHAVFELQDVVLSCRESGITPILDVVFNHSSMYDQNMLTAVLGGDYFRLNEDGQWLNRSMTGNELDTQKVAVRHLILESLRVWIEVYGFEGFRFDLAGLLDPILWDEIKTMVTAIQPGTLLIAEPWGGTYRPHEFSEAGWTSWNDRFRNGIKGIDPIHNQGAIFQQWAPDGSRATLENWLRGTLSIYDGGLFHHSSHSVNYLESHDGHTLGDFIRIAHQGENAFDPVTPESWCALSGEPLKQMKLAHLALLTTPGCVMLHQGQSFAHPKIIRVNESLIRLDHDAYNKDSETSWIDWSLMTLNQDLHRYTQGLVALRQASVALRRAKDDEICFDYSDNPWHLVKIVWGATTQDLYHYIVGYNFDAHAPLHIPLGRGPWECVVDDSQASHQTLHVIEEHVTDHDSGHVTGHVTVPPISGIVLRKLRQ
jgi:pullulanase/glycogen debranching enzyme